MHSGSIFLTNNGHITSSIGTFSNGFYTSGHPMENNKKLLIARIDWVFSGRGDLFLVAQIKVFNWLYSGVWIKPITFPNCFKENSD